MKGDWFYLLGDGTNPNWAIFVEPYSTANNRQQKQLNATFKGAKNEVQQAFSVLVKY